MDIEMALWAIEQNRNAEAALVQRRASARAGLAATSSAHRRLGWLARMVTPPAVRGGARRKSRGAIQETTDVRRSC